ncbi:MAG: hypothetical protein AAB209_03830, partial [Bacteroidota bacterium]
MSRILIQDSYEGFLICTIHELCHHPEICFDTLEEDSLDIGSVTDQVSFGNPEELKLTIPRIRNLSYSLGECYEKELTFL